MNKVTDAFVPLAYLVMGPIENNVYIIEDGEGCFVVDPTCDAERISAAIGERTLDAIVITHGHWDHTGAARALREKTGAEVIASRVEAPVVSGEASFTGHTVPSNPCPVDRMVDDGDVLMIGQTTWQVIATPGHTPGGICLFGQPSEGQGGAPVLVSGDTLFAGAHGRVDFDEGDPAAMCVSLARLAELPGETLVLPGHNGLTTIERERVWLKRFL